MKVTLIGYTPRPLYVCAEAAAACYDSEPDLKIIKGCIRSGHQSVLEHCSFTFRVEGISRVCSHQIVRHRIASYSQQSQRYVTYDDLDWALDGVPAELKEELGYYCDNALAEYKLMISKGVRTEDARDVLPNATPTVIYITFNLRAFMHFCNERMCSRASKEIHDVANAMVREVLAAQQISDEEKEILTTVLVPKCEAGQLKACPESAKDCCGRHKPIKDFVWRAKGRWIDVYEWAKMHDSTPSGICTYYWCSECEGAFQEKTKYCPGCGAEME